MFHPISYAVIALAGVIVGLELLFSLGELVPGIWSESQHLRIIAIRDFGFWDQIFTFQIQSALLFSFDTIRLISYPFIHLQLVDALFSAVFVLVWGSLLTKSIPPRVFVIIFFISSIIGGVGYVTLLNEEFPLLGSSTGYFGLMGGFMLILLSSWLQGNTEILNFWAVPVFFLSFSVGSQLVFGGPGYWVADLIGFIAGFVATSLICFGLRGSINLTLVLYNKLINQ